MPVLGKRKRSNYTRYPNKRRITSRTSKYPRRSSDKNYDFVDIGPALPKRIRVVHKFTDNISLASTAGVGVSKTYRCNSMYDLNQTDVLGGQPILYDTFSPLYRHWCVIGSSIEVTCVPNTANAGCAYLSLLQDDNTSQVLNTIQVSELPESQIKLIGAAQPDAVKVWNKWSARKIFGPNVLARDDLRGSASADPTEVTFWRVSLLEQSGLTFTARIMVRITYIAVWSEVAEYSAS